MALKPARSWRVCITCDVDLVDHLGDVSRLDELTIGVDELARICDRHDCPVTWFFRLDSQMEALFGQADYVWSSHGDLLARLAARGDELGWHPHVYHRCDDRWSQNTVESEVVAELERLGRVARDRGLVSARMGWGFQTNRSMAVLCDLGFHVDSSAIPRPRYPWEQSVKDWTTTGTTPYWPSRGDYRVSGDPALPILEVPMSVMPVSAPYDRQLTQRYCNLAFRPELLAAPLASWFDQHADLVAVTHPYEILPREQPHGLVAFDSAAVDANLHRIKQLAGEHGASVRFVTLGDVYDSARSGDMT